MIWATLTFLALALYAAGFLTGIIAVGRQIKTQPQRWKHILEHGTDPGRIDPP